LVFLVALSLLSALVWWRVLNRHAGDAQAAKPSCAASSRPPAPGKQLPNPASITVQVLNSTDRAGIAAAATTALQTDGFITVKQDNDTDAAKYGSHGLIAETAEIRYASAQAPAAKLLAYFFPGAKLVQRDGQNATVLVALGSAFQQVTATADAQAKITSDGLALAAPPATPAPTGAPAGTGAPATPSTQASVSC
jgi:hypothetical protein